VKADWDCTWACLLCSVLGGGWQLVASRRAGQRVTGHAAQELTTERIVAEADLKKQLGTLRYLQGLKAARQRMAAAAQGTAMRRVCTSATRGLQNGPPHMACRMLP